MSRPTIYTADTADRICELIATHCVGLKYALQLEEGLPEYRTVCRWIFNNEEFRQKYAHAKALQQELKGEEIEDIADDDSADATNPERIQRARLRIETRKWLMAKLAPKKYGDSTQIKHADADGGKLSLGDILSTIDGTTAGIPGAKD